MRPRTLRLRVCQRRGRRGHKTGGQVIEQVPTPTTAMTRHRFTMSARWTSSRARMRARHMERFGLRQCRRGAKSGAAIFQQRTARMARWRRSPMPARSRLRRAQCDRDGWSLRQRNAVGRSRALPADGFVLQFGADATFSVLASAHASAARIASPTLMRGVEHVRAEARRY